jgi:hypothetical protein
MTLHLLFSHALTPEQQADAGASLGVSRIQSLPADILPQWQQVPPDLERLYSYAQPFRDYLDQEAGEGDYALISGDYGLSFLMVQYARSKGLVPIYATTRRETVEEHQPDGSINIKRTFRHERFRYYE